MRDRAATGPAAAAHRRRTRHMAMMTPAGYLGSGEEWGLDEQLPAARRLLCSRDRPAPFRPPAGERGRGAERLRRAYLAAGADARLCARPGISREPDPAGLDALGHVRPRMRVLLARRASAQLFT